MHSMLGNLILVNPSQPQNAIPPILVTLFGIIILVISLHLSNNPLPISDKSFSVYFTICSPMVSN